MTCPPCEFEQHTQHADSPGVVRDEEVMCRAAFDPMHKGRDNSPKTSIIKDKDFLSGELSTWRLSAFAGSTLEEIVEILNRSAPKKNSLWRVYGVAAGHLRSLTFPSIANARGLCVKDDCVCDNSGNAHRLHATLALCRVMLPDLQDSKDRFEEIAKNDERYQQIKNDLRLAFLAGELWNADLAA